jgi:hypothetical protein
MNSWPSPSGGIVYMAVRNSKVEIQCQEGKITNDNINVLEERHTKISKEIKDVLLRQVNLEPSKLERVLSFGITAFKFKAFFDICHFHLGYIAHITLLKEFAIPPEIFSIGSSLLPCLSMILIF